MVYEISVYSGPNEEPKVGAHKKARGEESRSPGV